jgi:DNA modification methylase
MHTVEGETVLDPFLGSGTTLKICRLTKRKGIGFEINPGYRDLIQKRIEEDWNPPSIDSMYITMGSKQVNDLLESTINEVLNFVDRSDQLDTVRRKILKKLSKDKVFSKAFLEKLKQFSNPNDASTNQESSNEDLV